MRILHITPHLGGGVGAVILNWVTFDKNNEHKIITLDYANDNALKICKQNNIELYSQIYVEKIKKIIELNDIVLIHFWNHPLLYDFLMHHELPPCRIIFWAHVAGKEPPYVFNDKLFSYCDKFVLTTQMSLNYIDDKSNVATIISTNGVEKFANIEKIPHKNYVAGYVGTVDFAKMHPQFVQALSKTNADKIIVAGGDKENEISQNADERFIFTGKVDNVLDIYKQLDVFAYLLNPTHYGTAEQVLQEAMATGIVPIVLNNECEKNIVKHKKTGLVANDLNEFVEYVNLLKVDVELRNKLSNNARKYAIETFSLQKMTDEWDKVFEEVMLIKPYKRSWIKEKDNYDSFDIFLESLGKYANLFKDKNDEEIRKLLKDPRWSSGSKATPKQYYKYLQGEKLASIVKLYNS